MGGGVGCMVGGMCHSPNSITDLSSLLNYNKIIYILGENVFVYLFKGKTIYLCTLNKHNEGSNFQ